MTPFPKPDNRLYLGRGGSGKTTLALAHARKYSRVVIVCPNDDEAPRMGCDLVARDRRSLIEFMCQPRFRIAYAPGEERAEGWEWANEAAYRAGNCLIMWEEAGVYMGSQPLKGWAYKLWMTGRHRRCRVFACSQRPARVSRDCTANLSRAVIFHTMEPDDLQFFRGMMGRDACTAIPQLSYESHEALDWNGSNWAVRRAPFA
jgi:hypothetical protein